MEFRPYQILIFTDNTTGILGLQWARGLGTQKHRLAAWSVDRPLSLPESVTLPE